MKIEKKNALLGGIFAGVAALVLLLGIPFFGKDYFMLTTFKFFGEIFSNIESVLFYFTPILMFFVSVANIIIGVLMIFGIIKTNLVNKILSTVLAVLVATFFVFLLVYTKEIYWSIICMLVITVASAVWSFVSKKIVK